MNITLAWWSVPLVIWLFGAVVCWLVVSKEIGVSGNDYGIGGMILMLFQLAWAVPVLVLSLIYSVVFR